MSSYLVLQTSLGIYIFSDPQMILVDIDSKDDPNILKFLQKKACFPFNDPLIAAKIKYSVDDNYKLPSELIGFFTSFSNRNIKRASSAKWYFISQILCQLVSDKFKFLCFCLSASNQRLIYSSLPQLLETTQENIDNATRNLSLELCSEEFLCLKEKFDNNEEEENINEQEIYNQGYMFIDSDD